MGDCWLVMPEYQSFDTLRIQSLEDSSVAGAFPLETLCVIFIPILKSRFLEKIRRKIFLQSNRQGF